LLKEEGNNPCTSLVGIISWVKYTKLPNVEVSVLKSLGVLANYGPRKRDPTLLTPSTITH